MKLTRLISILALLSVLIAVFPAAAQDAMDVEFPVTLPEEVAAGEAVTISVGACIGEDQPQVAEQFDAQLARFSEAYPNVTVTRTQYCFSPETFAALVAGDQLPTLIGVPLTEPQRLINEGIVADLTEEFEQFGITDVYNPALLALVSDEEGRIYGFPEFAYAQGILYNREMLEAAGFDGPPQTWEELAEMAQALTTDDVVGFGMNQQGGGGGWNWTNLAYGFGATDLITTGEDGGLTASFGEGASVEAMEFLQTLSQAGALPADLGANPNVEVAEGRAAMSMTPGDALGWLSINMPDVDISQFGYAPMPAGPDGQRYSLTGGAAQLVNAAASEAEQEAATVFQIWRQLSPTEFGAGRALFHQTQAGMGSPVLPIYAGEFQEAVTAFDEQFITLPVENYAAFSDAVANNEITLVPEPPAAQDFYVAIADVMTQVLTDPNADVATLMRQAAETFQTGILDQMNTAE